MHGTESTPNMLVFRSNTFKQHVMCPLTENTPNKTCDPKPIRESPRGQYHLSFPPHLLGHLQNHKARCPEDSLCASDDSWWLTCSNRSRVGKAQQCLYYLRKLRGPEVPQQLMVNLYHCAIGSILTYSFLVWFSNGTPEGGENSRENHQDQMISLRYHLHHPLST